MKKSLLVRFKEIYEVGTDYHVCWSRLDSECNLTVGIADKKNIEVFWLHVREDNKGNIEWY